MPSRWGSVKGSDLRRYAPYGQRERLRTVAVLRLIIRAGGGALPEAAAIRRGWQGRAEGTEAVNESNPLSALAVTGDADESAGTRSGAFGFAVEFGYVLKKPVAVHSFFSSSLSLASVSDGV